MANLKLVADAIFSKRSQWKSVPEIEKESCFFIMNRYFSKKYPEKAQLLNIKGIDKIAAMDIWFHFMQGKPCPSWLWSKSEAKSQEYPEKDINMLVTKLKLRREDVEYLLRKHPEIMQEELKYYKSLEKEK